MIVRWSAAALVDLDRIETYLDAIDATVAASTVTALMSSAQTLETFPLRGSSIENSVRVLRSPRTPYRLLYEAREGEVIVLRIRHAREDWRPE